MASLTKFVMVYGCSALLNMSLFLLKEGERTLCLCENSQDSSATMCS